MNDCISPVAKWDLGPHNPSKFCGNHFIAFLDRYDSPDKKSRGCGAIILELSYKSKMAANMSAITGANTILTMTPAVVMLFSQFVCLVICFQTRNSFKYIFSKISSIFVEEIQIIEIKLIKINGNSCHLK